MQTVKTDADGYPVIPGHTQLPACADLTLLRTTLEEFPDCRLTEDRLNRFVDEELAGMLANVRQDALFTKQDDETTTWTIIKARAQKRSFKLAVSHSGQPRKAALYIKGDATLGDKVSESDRRNAGFSICHFLAIEILHWATGKES